MKKVITKKLIKVSFDKRRKDDRNSKNCNLFEMAIRRITKVLLPGALVSALALSLYAENPVKIAGNIHNMRAGTSIVFQEIPLGECVCNVKINHYKP
ncbi:MAG: hypothetical protein LBM08_15380 [Dysgonamonadaceae bacterium]|jgi:hypothetical protein|nr:hypothetical protein [Dysgonamonadaceae bacterium]